MGFLRRWVKNHKRESVIGANVSAISIVAMVIFLFIYNKESEQEVERSQQEEAQHSSSSSSHEVYEPPSGGASSSISHPSHSAGPLRQNTDTPQSNNSTLPDTSPNHPNSTFPKPLRVPQAQKTLLTAKPKLTTEPPLPPNIEHKSNTGESAEEEEQSLICTDSINFAAALENFRKKGHIYLPREQSRSVGSADKKDVSGGINSKVAHLLSINPLLQTAGKTPFEKAHNKAVGLLVETLVKGKCDSAQLESLTAAFNAAKTESQLLPESNVFAREYKSATLQDFAFAVTQPRFFGGLAQETFLNSGKSSQFDLYAEYFFRSCQLMEMLGIHHLLEPGSVDFSKDLQTQLQKLFFQTATFYKKVEEMLLMEFTMPSEDTQKIKNIIENWKSVVPVTAISKETPKGSFMPEAGFNVRNLADIASAKVFCHQALIDSILTDHFQKGQDASIDRKVEYSRLRKQPEAAALAAFATVEDLIAFYHPKVILAVQDAVLPNPPQRGDLSFASSVFQSLANFLPLFKSSLAYKQTGGAFAENFKKVLEKLATQSANSPGFTPSDVIAHPSYIVDKFLRDFPHHGFLMVGVCGFIKPHHYSTFRLAMTHHSIKESIESIEMIGQLFIYNSVGKVGGLGQEDLPLHLDMRVVGLKEQKRYELYSVIFGFGARAVSFVKRGNGKWYDTNDTKKPTEMAESSIPLSATKQVNGCAPIMAFYLRTQA